MGGHIFCAVEKVLLAHPVFCTSDTCLSQGLKRLELGADPPPYKTGFQIVWSYTSVSSLFNFLFYYVYLGFRLSSVFLRLPILLF
jgi:hypothetical protein